RRGRRSRLSRMGREGRPALPRLELFPPGPLSPAGRLRGAWAARVTSLPIPHCCPPSGVSEPSKAGAAQTRANADWRTVSLFPSVFPRPG
ncbi:hypothetical protein P7K49_018566, partial [Saguinus oedipus]